MLWQCEDHRDLLLRRLDSVSLSRLRACRRELREAMNVVKGSATVKDCDLRGQVKVAEGAEPLLQKCTVYDCAEAAVSVEGTAVIQDCIIQDNKHNGNQVVPTG